MVERTFIQAITDTMWEEMARDDKVFLLGQDIGPVDGRGVRGIAGDQAL